MRCSILTCSVACLAWLAIACDVSVAQKKKILFFQNPAAGWAPDFDEPLIAYMESLGYDVTPYDTAANDAVEQIDLANSHDLVYVTESLGSVTTHDGFETNIKQVETPQIWAEAFSWDEAALTGDFIHEDYGNTQRPEPVDADGNPVDALIVGQETMNIVAPGHPLAAGFTGAVKVYDQEYSLNFAYTKTMGKGATIIATIPDAPDYASYFVYEKGAELEDGSKAAGMRIGMWIGQAGQGNPFFDNITDDGKKLIKAAIEYALGDVPTGCTLRGDFTNPCDAVLDAKDIDLLSTAIRTGTATSAMDLNSDGNFDQADRTVWVNDLKRTWFGDANLDGEFNSSDFVLVFQAGQYEDGVPGNSGWATGDWNGDGEFDSGDFVTAFQAGGFEKGPRPPAAAVPEPHAAALAVLAASALAFYRRGW